MAFTRLTFEQKSFPYSANPKDWTYKSSTDSLSTISASGYFDDISDLLTINDLIYVVASDDQAMLRVTAVSPAVTVAAFTNGYVQQATVAVSSAEVLALRATPKTLVAAPGAGLYLEFVSAILALNYNSAGYTESADNMAVKFTDGSGAAVSQTIEATGFIDQTADTVTNALAKIDAIVAASSCINKALVLHNTGDGEYAAGNSPLVVVVNYRVHALGL